MLYIFLLMFQIILRVFKQFTVDTDDFRDFDGFLRYFRFIRFFQRIINITVYILNGYFLLAAVRGKSFHTQFPAVRIHAVMRSD